MKKIKIFIGSSIVDLHDDRLSIVSFIQELNNKYIDRDCPPKNMILCIIFFLLSTNLAARHTRVRRRVVTQSKGFGSVC